MTYKEHFIELWINGQKVDLESQKSLNLRFQNVLFNPEKITSNQGEYSFEFEIPSTPNNDKIFDYANNLSKVGKFRVRFNAIVYADGQPIFTGTLIINSFKNKQYSCNLVSVKVYSLDEIFGDSVLSDIDNWKIEFNGTETINQINEETLPEVMFPLVAYGPFQKTPIASDSVGNEYTSKYDLDEYNMWYVESFAPSLRLVDALKHAFAYKGYELAGDIMSDFYLNQIYLSNNYADGQSPDYNIGNPRFGKVSINIAWQTPTSGTPYTQNLRFPYWRAGGYYDIADQTTKGSSWNFSDIQVYNMMSAAEGGSYTQGAGNKSYMIHPDSSIIVIPADGWYKIKLDALATLSPSQSALTASQWCLPSQYASDWEQEDVTIPVSFKTTMPFELQLVRNYEDNIELITGKNKFFTRFGYPNEDTKWNINNRLNVLTCFPHERLGTNWVMGMLGLDYRAAPPTEINDLGTTNAAAIINHGYSKNTIYTPDCTLGYVYKDNTPMAYDQAVSPAFIAGFTSMGNDNGGGCAAIMKEGYSWSHTVSEKNESFYVQPGYDRASTTVPIIGIDWDNIYYTPTDYQKNDYINQPTMAFTETDTEGNRRFAGQLYCMVYLNKNDILQVMAIQRDYKNENGIRQLYSVAAICNLEIEAATPRAEYELLRDGYGYDSPVEFDTLLNLANFMNKEKKISEWVQNVIDAFNLDVVQNNKIVELNTKKKFNRNMLAAVELDDRVNANQIEAERINYPKSMSVKYKIDTDEHGFYESVPPDKINLPDWKNYGESGYSVVELNDDLYAVNTSEKNLNFSYTWYDDFNWYAVDSGFTKTSDTPVTLTIPVISKEEYMIDGYDYTESLKHDGYGLTQRFWFRPKATNQYIWTRTDPAEQVFIYEPKNLYTNFQDIYMNLSYKIDENSLLKQYFNFIPYLASNYIIVEVYLTPDEYNMLKGGALVHIDSDLYYPVEINGYDASGYNPTELKLMKKL